MEYFATSKAKIHPEKAIDSIKMKSVIEERIIHRW